MSLDALFNPRSIAIVGASADGSSVAGRPLRILVQHGYAGTLYPVNPKYQELFGRRAYGRIAELPEPVDLAMIAVPARHVLGVLQECAEVRTKVAMVFSSGFAESDEHGARLQDEIQALCERTSMRISGPNCEGLFNVSAGVPAGFSPAIDPERGWRGAAAGPVSIVAQSGGLGFALFNRGMEQGLGFSKVVTTGNEVDLTWLDYVDYLVDDPETRVILGFLESLREPRRLVKVARKAAERGKPIVVAKMGRSGAAREAAASHTGSMVGSDDALDALFRQVGVIRVDDVDELLDAAAYFSVGRLPAGPNVAIVTVSGGAGVWLADACVARGLNVPTLDDEIQAEIRSFLPTYGSARNPVDVTAQTVVDGGLERALGLVAESDRFDSIVVITSLAGDHIFKRYLPELESTLERTPKPVVYFSYTSPTEDAARLLREHSVPLFLSPGRVARALEWAVQYRHFLESRSDLAIFGDRHVEATVGEAPDAPGTSLTEVEARASLAGTGIPSPVEGLARSADEAEEIFAKICAPVAMKVQARGLVHKTDVGGVRLDVSDGFAVRRAYEEIVLSVTLGSPGATVEGVLVQQMVVDGIEMILGSRWEPGLGHLVLVGFGGIHVELLHDASIRLAPVSHREAREMLGELRAYPLLLGVRGADRSDLAALVDAVVSFSEFVGTTPPRFREVEINPLVVLPEGRGVMMVDAAVHVTGG